MKLIKIIVILSLLFEINTQLIDRIGEQAVKATANDENLFQKLRRAKNNLHSIQEKKDKKGFKMIIDGLLSSQNLEKLNKGRKSEDTKAILGYMISASYSMHQKNKSFETDKFFDEVNIFYL